MIHIEKKENFWSIDTSTHRNYHCKNIIIATGSSPKIWDMLQRLGHRIVPPVPSLFTFYCDDNRIKQLQGISTLVHLEISEKNKKLFTQQDQLLITHWGFSGPATLKLSARAARWLHEKNYKFSLRINWIPEYTTEEIEDQILLQKQIHGKKQIGSVSLGQLPKKLWLSLVKAAEIDPDSHWANLSKKQTSRLSQQLSHSVFSIQGKAPFKEEFVTAGGVSLKEIHFKSFESKLFSKLYVVGEALDIDAVTGGFNFQHAWTSAYIASYAITSQSTLS